MSNINWNQFTNNFFNNFGEIVSNNAGNASPSMSNQQILQNTPMEVLFPEYTAQLKETTNELVMLNQEQTINMIRDLLSLPKSFENLLSQLTVNQSAAQGALLLLNSSLDLNQLSALLRNNSKTALTALYQMLAEFNQSGMSLKDEQLAILTKLISFTSACSNSELQTLRTTMLMYLPWLPLINQEAFKLEFSKNCEDGKSPDDSVKILISTKNYGNLHSDIYKTDEDGIKIEIISSETFPLKEFKDLMREESIKYSININFELSKKESFNKEKNETAQIQVYMNTSPGVNPFLLLMSNLLIKNVHIIDKKENLREYRKEKMDG